MKLLKQVAKLMNHGLSDDEIADRVTDGGFKHPVSPIFIGVIRDIFAECDRCSIKAENERMSRLLYDKKRTASR